MLTKILFLKSDYKLHSYAPQCACMVQQYKTKAKKVKYRILYYVFATDRTRIYNYDFLYRPNLTRIYNENFNLMHNSKMCYFMRLNNVYEKLIFCLDDESVMEFDIEETEAGYSEIIEKFKCFCALSL